MGTKLKIWKQGQFYQKLGKKIIDLPYQVNQGPSDHQIKIGGFTVQPDKDGNFLDRNYSEDELDAIHTYGVTRLVIDLYENLFEKPLKWIWQQNGSDEPLTIRIRNNDINARYLKDQKCIELDYYGPYKNWTYNCRTVDLVAHETGHAILDSILPFLNEGNAETKGLSEAFCDLTAMFIVLSQYDLCEYVIEETRGDLKLNSILTLFAAGHGFSKGPNKESRSALNDIKYNRNEWSPYHYSQVIVGLLYDLFCEKFNKNERRVNDDAENLYQIGQVWIAGITNTFMECGADSNLNDFGRKLLRCFSNEMGFIEKHLKKRKIF